MYRTKKYLAPLLSFVCLSMCATLHAQSTTGPVIAGDLADPSIIKVDSVYYATGTSSEWAPYYPVYKSSDLKDWRQTGYVFDKAPAWTVGSFWAPEYYKIGDTYYIYYTARRKSDNQSFIGVATSRYPDHGFTDHGVIIEHGKEAIDAFIYDDNGQRYITFKAYGLENRPIEILGYKLSADGLKTEGEAFTLLKDDNRAGMEGQSILKKDNYYYLFYSAGNCCGGGCTYSVNVARATSFKGPYEYFEGNPILSENDSWKCMGHGTFVTADDHQTYYLHHAYNKKSTVFTGREALLSQLSWQTPSGWPALKTVDISTTTPVDLYDPFDGKKPAKYWQWDFRHATPAIQLQKGTLRLSGVATKENPAGIALTVRPIADNFEMSTSVTNHNKALKGLVIYGDANAAIGIGVEGDSVKVWKTENKQRITIKAAPIPASTIGLKIAMSGGNNCEFFYQTDDATWTSLATGLATGSLAQWDRSPRLGLQYSGNKNENAQFAFFRLHNK